MLRDFAETLTAASYRPGGSVVLAELAGRCLGGVTTRVVVIRRDVAVVAAGSAWTLLLVFGFGDRKGLFFFWLFTVVIFADGAVAVRTGAAALAREVGTVALEEDTCLSVLRRSTKSATKTGSTTTLPTKMVMVQA